MLDRLKEVHDGWRTNDEKKATQVMEALHGAQKRMWDVVLK